MLRVVPTGLDENFTEQLPSPKVNFQRVLALPSCLDRPASLIGFVPHIVATNLTQCPLGASQVVFQPSNQLPTL
jgi:hypothetical protein